MYIVCTINFQGLWSLRKASNNAFDTYLVQSFIGETRVLAIEGEEMEEVRQIEEVVVIEYLILYSHTLYFLNDITHFVNVLWVITLI